MSVSSRKRRTAIAEINITPLVDVMLVILIIFMVVAPTIQHGVKVDVPEATFEAMETNEAQIIVSVTKNGTIYINKLETDIKTLEAKLRRIYQAAPSRELFLKADKKVAYEHVMKTMAAIKRAGISKIGMITEPERE